jgi:tetratricopeptide (TPR) repeat protein
VKQDTSEYYRAKFLLYQARSQLAKKETKKALRMLEQALKMDPNQGDALMTLAQVLRNQGRDERARMYYIRAEALPLFEERAQLSRAQLEIDRRNYPEALRLLRKVLVNNPQRADIIANIQSLESLIRNQS